MAVASSTHARTHEICLMPVYVPPLVTPIAHSGVPNWDILDQSQHVTPHALLQFEATAAPCHRRSIPVTVVLQAAIVACLRHCKQEIMLSSRSSFRASIGPLQTQLRGGRQRIWDDHDISPRTAPSQGARKCTYARWFRKPSWASPLTLPLTHAAMQRLLRFRTGYCGLPKDIGSQSGAPRRLCQLCGTGFADEMHLVFECATMADLRGQFPYIFQAHQTMHQIMWQPNLLQVAKFLDAAMTSLQTVDPDEGSNISSARLAGMM